jgi:hypothetical protein
MIHQDLSQIEGCPKEDVKVTIYGLNPWNCLLTFGVDAGPVRNRAELQGFCDIITERLKRLYDVRDPHVGHNGFGLGAEPALGCFGALKSVQEQSQIITSAIGRPVPKAPPIISANRESRFASQGISG